MRGTVPSMPGRCPGRDTVDVRPLTERDLDVALPLIAGYQRFYGAEPDDERNRSFFRRFLAPSDDGLLLGAWLGDDLVGFATLYWTFSSTNAAEAVLMNDLFVRPGHRGHGVGRELIDASAKVARRRGAPHLEWLTAMDNEVAQRLYDRLGATRSSWFAYELPAVLG